MKRFINNEDGNFAIIFALAVSTVMLAVGVAMDSANLIKAKEDLQGIVDSAALAGANQSDLSPDDRLKLVEQIILENAQGRYPDILSNVTIDFDDINEEVTVSANHNEKLLFSGFIGRDEMEVAPKTTVSYKAEKLTPLTMVFALDTSGSMRNPSDSGEIKIDVLKSATGILFDELRANTRNAAQLDNSLRTGMSSYNTNLVDSQPLDWGHDHLEAAINAMFADGGTNSTPSLQYAYDQLRNDRSFRQANDSKFRLKDLREYVLFMTDGDNNQDIFDEDSLALCQTMRGEGIEIYSVAFTAPDKGKLLLLDCASFSADKTEPRHRRGKTNKCGNAGTNGNGRAIGHCGDHDLESEKAGYYFDASRADEFRAAFAEIGREISPSNVRIKS